MGEGSAGWLSNLPKWVVEGNKLPQWAVALVPGLLVASCSMPSVLEGGTPGHTRRSADDTLSMAQLMVEGMPSAFCDAQLLSIDDNGARYELSVTVAFAPDLESPHDAVFVCEGVRVPAATYSDGEAKGTFQFILPKEDAKRVAKVLGICPTERAAWPGSLNASLILPRIVHIDSDATMLFIVENVCDIPIRLAVGDRLCTGTSRSNRFHVEMTCDGDTVPIKSCDASGGRPEWKEIAPGEHAELDLRFGDWCSMHRPGSYSIRVTYDADLSPIEYDPECIYSTAMRDHIIRSRILVAQGYCELR